MTCTIREGGGLCEIQQQGREVIDMGRWLFVSLYGICLQLWRESHQMQQDLLKQHTNKCSIVSRSGLLQSIIKHDNTQGNQTNGLFQYFWEEALYRDGTKTNLLDGVFLQSSNHVVPLTNAKLVWATILDELALLWFDKYIIGWLLDENPNGLRLMQSYYCDKTL